MASKCNEILRQVQTVIIGKDEILAKVLMAILSGGHILLEDVPGVGKTTLALAFAKTLGIHSKRMQFTSDSMPSDVIGFSVYDTRTEQIIGTLEEVRPSPASDLYCIATPRGQVLIPAVPAFVHRVDFENRRLELNTIPGMLPDEN